LFYSDDEESVSEDSHYDALYAQDQVSLNSESSHYDTLYVED